MKAREAREIARRWALEYASHRSDVHGAFLLGSINYLPDDAPFPRFSDVDVKVLVSGPDSPFEVRKVAYESTIVEFSCSSADEFKTPEAVLANYPMAQHFTTDNVLLDPSGALTAIQRAVVRDFARRRWVEKRCQHARDWLLTSLSWFDPSAPLRDQVFVWVYALGVAAHLILVADLQNPTVRKCLVASRDVLAKYEQLSLHETMLRILGSVRLSPVQVASLLGSCAAVFDAVKDTGRTPFFLSTDVTELARPMAIGGSREMIESGDHRESVFWIALIHTLCQTVLENDWPPHKREKLTPRYQRLLAELGINSGGDLEGRINHIREIVPRVWDVSEDILRRNPQVVR